MNQLADESVDLVATSPPYPMIGVWDGRSESAEGLVVQKALHPLLNHFLVYGAHNLLSVNQRCLERLLTILLLSV